MAGLGAVYNQISAKFLWHYIFTKICVHENMIVNITAYSVIYFDAFLIHEIKMQKSCFEAFCRNLVPQKFQTIVPYLT